MAAQGAALQSHNNELVKCEWPSPAIPVYESLNTTRPLDQHAIQLTLWDCSPVRARLPVSTLRTAWLLQPACTVAALPSPLLSAL